ncbi:DMT family transporter [Suttonella indologenes]|uniref:Guanidinium exporter n=1 Tax=Suttonella indologenes TaxID=13276 RepID=A0A380MX49_9GAMM|nr:multidrug efflux SMR transporter [Suttonella indologenes]SUO96754.1 Quaternary ammonium compound-resistance protein sugE [Suttonella indologenes]
MAWIYLISAGIAEIGWPLGLKLAQQDGKRLLGTVIAAAFLGISGFLLYLAQKSIPMGTAYAVWTGIGAVGAFLIGIVFFKDNSHWGRWLGACLIIGGVIMMKLAG